MGTVTRVTKGQVAAICGLKLVGIGYMQACRMVAATPAKFRGYVPPDWRRGNLPIRKRAMTREQLKLYEKLQPIVGRNAAFEQVFP